MVAASSFGLGAARAAPDERSPTSAKADGAQRVAQLATGLESAIAAAERAERTRADLTARRTQVAAQHQQALSQIDTLKRQKPSWRRDRELRSKLATSLELATSLASLAEQLKRVTADVVRTRDRAVAAIERALPLVSGSQRAELERRRRSWTAPRPEPRRIVLPDDALDLLADPEELEQQAAALRESELALGGEIERLAQQADRLDRMAAVRKQHDRSEQLDRRDDVDPRRSAARSGGEPAASDDAAPPVGDVPEGDVSGAGGGGDSSDFATVLAEVVDPKTVDALRSSERSTDPSVRAGAARRARQAVAERLTRLRQRRAAIEQRARELRTGE